MLARRPVRRRVRGLSRLLNVLLLLALLATTAPPVYAAEQVNVKLNHALGLNERVVDFLVSPDGSRIVYRARAVASGDVPLLGPARLFSVPAAGVTAVPLTPSLAANQSIEGYQFSADGSEIFFQRSMIDATLGNVFEIFRIPAAGPADAAELVIGPISVGSLSPDTLLTTCREAQVISFDASWLAAQPQATGQFVRTLNCLPRLRTQPERITGSVTDGTSNTLALGEEFGRVTQFAFGDGSVRFINPPLVDGGVVYDFEVTPDGTRAIYRADQNIDGTIELFSVPADGSDTGFRISGRMVAGGDVQRFRISGDSSRAVYLADQTTNGVDELYSAPARGGIVAKLNPALTAGGNVTQFELSPDGSLVVYLADDAMDGKFDVFAVAVDGSGNTILSGGQLGGSVRSFLISPDGDFVYFVDNGGPNGTLSIVQRPLVLGATLSFRPPASPVANLPVPDVKISPDSSHLVYLADAGNDGVLELATLALPQLNALPAPGGNLRAFQISPDSQRVVYAADQNTPGVVELFSVPIGGGSVEQVSGPLVPGGSVGTGPQDIQFSPDGRSVYYLADQDTDNVVELYVTFEAPVVAFSQADYVVIENTNPDAGSFLAPFVVTRTGNTAGAGEVLVQLTGQPDGGTAKGGASLGSAGVDFVENARTITFAPGEITKTFTVGIKNDGVAEAAETFSMLLFDPFQVAIGTPDAAEVVILDTADSPLLSDQAVVVPENSPTNTPVLPAQMNAAALEATGATTYTILSGNTNNAFRIDNSGALFVDNSAALNFEVTPVFVLVVEARSDGGSFDLATWTINLQNQNESPQFNAQTRSVAENSPVNSNVGSKLVASDPDGDPLTFSMTAGVFKITSNGQLLVNNSSALDFETKSQHAFNVTVSDGKGGSKAATITVNVLDVAESDPTAPVISALSPASAVAGGTDFRLVVTGKNFSDKTVVRWNGSSRPTVLVSGSLVALISAADIKAATTAKVDVLNTGTKQTSNAVLFPVTLGKVGIAELDVESAGTGLSIAGQPTVFNLTWTHTTEGWRTMDEMDLRLIDGEQIPLWVRYQETRDAEGKDISTLILLNPDGTPAGSGRFGEAKVLENATVRLDLAQATFTPSAEEDSRVSVRLPVTFKAAAAQGEPYTIEMYGVDDLGGEQGPNLMGSWKITAPLYLPALER